MRYPLRFISAVSCLALGVVAAVAQTSAPNLVENPSLDGPLEKSNLPKGWYSFGGPTGSQKVTIIDQGRTDNRAVQIQAGGEYAGAVANPVPLEPGKLYSARAWVKLEGPPTSNATLKLDLFNSDRKYITSTKDNPTVKAVAGKWQLLSFDWRADDIGEAKTVSVACTVGSSGVAVFDDVELIARDVPKEENLLPDGSMEFIAGDTPLRWKLNQNPEGTVKALRRQVPVKDGWYSTQLQGQAQWVIWEPATIPLTPGKRYTITGYARARKGKIQIRIAYFNDSGYLGQTLSEPVAGNEWQKLTVTSELEKFPTATRITPGGHGMGEIDAFFDAFVFRME